MYLLTINFPTAKPSNLFINFTRYVSEVAVNMACKKKADLDTCEISLMDLSLARAKITTYQPSVVQINF